MPGTGSKREKSSARLCAVAGRSRNLTTHREHRAGLRPYTRTAGRKGCSAPVGYCVFPLRRPYAAGGSGARRQLEAGEVKRPAAVFNAAMDTRAVANSSDVQMALNDGSVQVVQNGEIFNYLELRSELEKRGHKCSYTHGRLNQEDR